MTTSVDTHKPLNISDRCDKCGAQAMIRATLANGELYFCGHHGRDIGSKLIGQSLVVYDPSEVFNYGRK
jgi:hypothetical protein